MAILVLVRNFFDVEIHNGNDLWIPRFEFSEQYQTKVLVIDVAPAPYPLDGVSFKISRVPKASEECDWDDGCTPEDTQDSPMGAAYEDIHMNYLMDVKDNTILYEEHMQGRIFVGGLFVCKLDGFRFGYNFAPARLRLDRDRGMANMMAVKTETAKCWRDSPDRSALYDALRDGVPDVDYLSLIDTSPNQDILDRFKKENPDCLPIASQKEAEFFSGNKTSIVPQSFRDLLWNLHTFKFSQRGTPGEMVQAFMTRFRWQLDDEARTALAKIVEYSKHWTGPSDDEYKDDDDGE